MKKLTLISLLSLVGCWDFQALSSGQTLSDAGHRPTSRCVRKPPNSLQEDCTNPDADINNNCLPGCLDPTCDAQLLLGKQPLIAVRVRCGPVRRAASVKRSFTKTWRRRAVRRRVRAHPSCTGAITNV